MLSTYTFSQFSTPFFLFFVRNPGFSVPVEYLQAVVRGEEVLAMAAIKFCPQCWNPGGVVDLMWGNVRARFCYLCGTQLRSSCANCGELVVSLRYKFCPLCGKPYKDGGEN
jgi:hypothetical protein